MPPCMLEIEEGTHLNPGLVVITVVASWLEHQIPSQENPVSNPCAAVSKLGQFRLVYVGPVHSAVSTCT